MTSYHGGKQRIGKDLAEVIYNTSTDIENNSNFKIKGYCEPFCGMLGVYRHIPELFEDHKPGLKYLAGDANESVVKMWKRAQKGWKPPTSCTKKRYEELKRSKDKSSAEKGFVGHVYSFGGQFFQGFRQDYSKQRVNAKYSSDKVSTIASELKNVRFSSGSYTQFSSLKGYILYCDPPYEDTQCVYHEKFNTSEFKKWCEQMSKHNIIFVSEYTKYPNSVVVYQQKVKRKLGNQQSQKVEKMFVM